MTKVMHLAADVSERLKFNLNKTVCGKFVEIGAIAISYHASTCVDCRRIDDEANGEMPSWATDENKCKWCGREFTISVHLENETCEDCKKFWFG